MKTKARAERQTEVVLAGRGIEVYLPAIKPSVPRRSGGTLEPLFPGYLFAHIDVALDEWLKARSAPGVAYVLGAEGKPSPVPDGIVRAVRQKLMACGGVLRPRLAKGDPVVIVGGPFAGIEAVFDAQLNGEGRSRVLLGVLGRLTPLEISVYNLRRAG